MSDFSGIFESSYSVEQQFPKSYAYTGIAVGAGRGGDRVGDAQQCCNNCGAVSTTHLDRRVAWVSGRVLEARCPLHGPYSNSPMLRTAPTGDWNCTPGFCAKSSWALIAGSVPKVSRDPQIGKHWCRGQSSHSDLISVMGHQEALTLDSIL